MARELKTELRKMMKSLLSKISTEEQLRQSEAVTDKVISSNWFMSSKRLSIYVSTNGEIQTDTIIRTALEMGKEVFIPQFVKGSSTMQMVKVPDLKAFSTLPVTLWGIRQPDPTWKWAQYQDSGPLDAILAPGVAFTSSGARCGHGKGYYDRFFAEHTEHFKKSPWKVGLALREQIVENVPISNTDVQLDDVIFC